MSEQNRRGEDLAADAELRRRSGLTPIDGRRVIGVATSEEARRERDREERARAARLHGDA